MDNGIDNRTSVWRLKRRQKTQGTFLSYTLLYYIVHDSRAGSDYKLELLRLCFVRTINGTKRMHDDTLSSWSNVLNLTPFSSGPHKINSHHKFLLY